MSLFPPLPKGYLSGRTGPLFFSEMGNFPCRRPWGHTGGAPPSKNILNVYLFILYLYLKNRMEGFRLRCPEWFSLFRTQKWLRQSAGSCSRGGGCTSRVSPASATGKVWSPISRRWPHVVLHPRSQTISEARSGQVARCPTPGVTRCQAPGVTRRAWPL